MLSDGFSSTHQSIGYEFMMPISFSTPIQPSNPIRLYPIMSIKQVHNNFIIFLYISSYQVKSIEPAWIKV